MTLVKQGNVKVRKVEWDDVEIPFLNPPSTALPAFATLCGDINEGDVWWEWSYKGMKGYLCPAVLANGVQAAMDAMKGQKRWAGVPRDATRFMWRQTTPSMNQELEELVEARPDAEPSGRGEPHEQVLEASEPSHDPAV